jgi:hypothetical protein
MKSILHTDFVVKYKLLINYRRVSSVGHRPPPPSSGRASVCPPVARLSALDVFLVWLLIGIKFIVKQSTCDCRKLILHPMTL